MWSQAIAFGGALSLCSVSCTSLTKNSNTKVVKHFDRDCPCSKQCRLFQTFSVPFNGCSTVESLRVTTSTKRCTKTAVEADTLRAPSKRIGHAEEVDLR